MKIAQRIARAQARALEAEVVRLRNLLLLRKEEKLPALRRQFEIVLDQWAEAAIAADHPLTEEPSSGFSVRPWA